jgi:hypothetical protein
MTLNDHTLEFSRAVGFIMSTQKNRLTNFWERIESDLVVTVNEEFNAENSTFQIPLFHGNVINFDTANKIPHVYFNKKNDWIMKQQEFCAKDLGIANVDSTCYYYDIFDDPSVPYVDF